MSTNGIGACDFPGGMRLERLRFVLVAAASVAAAACRGTPEDLREWRPSDHHHQTEASGDTGRAPARVSGSAEPPAAGLDEVTIAAWRRNCVSCHGQFGRGDGPQAAMVKPRDLSNVTWQASVSDTQLGESIAKGRGQMPGFPLPAKTIENLVRLVRLLPELNRPKTPPPSPSGG
jgi:mono/diheme cytochrome c family protein